MKIARKMCGDSPQFFASRDGSAFGNVLQLGFDCADLEDVCRHLDDISAALTSDAVYDEIADRDLLCPVPARGNLICVGLNYYEHAKETNLGTRDNPYLFGKWSNCLTPPYSPVTLDPEFTRKLDYEVELGVIIGRPIARGQRGDLRDAVLGYVVANDVSARDVQFDEGSWNRAKSSDTHCPLGPYITTADEVADVQDLTLECRVNGELRQKASTAQMIFGVDEILAFITRNMSLNVGDVVLTGTPAGVAFGMESPKWLNPGDVVRCDITGLGGIENVVQLDN